MSQEHAKEDLKTRSFLVLTAVGRVGEEHREGNFPETLYVYVLFALKEIFGRERVE